MNCRRFADAQYRQNIGEVPAIYQQKSDLGRELLRLTFGKGRVPFSNVQNFHHQARRLRRHAGDGSLEPAQYEKIHTDFLVPERASVVEKYVFFLDISSDTLDGTLLIPANGRL